MVKKGSKLRSVDASLLQKSARESGVVYSGDLNLCDLNLCEIIRQVNG